MNRADSTTSPLELRKKSLSLNPQAQKRILLFREEGLISEGDGGTPDSFLGCMVSGLFTPLLLL